MRPLLPVFLAFTLLSGCGLFGGDDEPDTTFTLRVNGVTDEPREGALFGTDSAGGYSRFLLQLGISGRRPYVTFGGLDAGLPAEGTWAVTDTNGAAPGEGSLLALYVVPSASLDEFPTYFIADAGSLTLETVAEDRLTGTFSFEAAAYDFETGEQTGETANVSGTFEARRNDAILGGFDPERPLRHRGPAGR